MEGFNIIARQFITDVITVITRIFLQSYGIRNNIFNQKILVTNDNYERLYFFLLSVIILDDGNFSLVTNNQH